MQVRGNAGRHLSPTPGAPWTTENGNSGKSGSQARNTAGTNEGGGGIEYDQSKREPAFPHRDFNIGVPGDRWKREVKFSSAKRSGKRRGMLGSYVYG